MNNFGSLFKVSIFGESHGINVGVVIDGCPAGIYLHKSLFLEDIERRKGGIQKGTTPRKETDEPIVVSGVFNSYTTGAPITILFENNNTRSGDYEKQRAVPRPGHADFVANKKFGGFEDYRGGGHFSGRLTVCLVAVGVVAKQLLLQQNISVAAGITSICGENDIEAGLQKGIAAKDSVGGIVHCEATNIPIGVGEPFFGSLESMLAQAVFAIPAVKGIEFGAGFAAANMFGSQHNDAIINADGTTATNHAGGIVGGISNGNNLSFNIAIKPTSSTPKEQNSLNWETGEVENFSIKGRHDLCIALRVPVVLEAVTAMVLVDALLVAQKMPKVFTEQAVKQHIYHVADKTLWEQAVAQNEAYEHPSLAQEGFIHLCKANQLQGVLDRYYVGATNIVLLTIAPDKLVNDLKYEIASSVNEWFPHVYGGINIDAVIAQKTIN